MSKKETRLPALTTLESIKEALDVRLGRRGDPLDRALTMRDIIDSGVPVKAVRRTGPSEFYLEYEDRPIKLVPKVPEGLIALSVFGGIHILWDAPEIGISRLTTEISRSTSSDPETRDVLTYVGGYSFLDMVDSQDETEYFYWVRFLSDSGHYGPYSAPVSATATPRVSDTLEELTGQIDGSHLSGSLAGEIERIDDIDTALDTERQARIDAVQAEADARVSDIQAEADARIAAILAEQQARAAAINSEQSARLDGDNALAIRVDELAVKIDSLPVFSSGFEDGNDYNQWAAGAASTLAAETSDIYIGTQAARVSSTATAPSASGIPGGVIAPIPEGTATAFAGKRIRVRVHAKKPAAGASAEFAVAYSTNDGATSGWQAFTPDATWQAFEFLYDVPAGGTNTDYLSIWADTSGGGGELLLDAVTVEAVASDIPEFTAAIQSEQQARIDGDEALASELTILEAEAASNLQAAIAQEQAARASLQEAVATDVGSLTARVGDNESEISSVQIAQAEAEMTSALMRSLVAVQDAAASAMVRTEETARIEEDSAIASRVTTVEARIDDDISAAIQTEQTARVSADDALATQIDTVESSLGGDIAAVQQDLNSEVTRLDGRVASNAQAITTAQSQLGGDIAAVQQDLNSEVTRLDGRVDSTSQAITTARSQLGDDIASVQTNLETRINQVNSWGSSFDTEEDYAQWVGGNIARVSDSYSGSHGARVTGGGSSPSSGGSTGSGAHAIIPEAVAQGFGGRRVRVSLYAKRPSSGASTEFAVAFSTAEVGNSGWQRFTPGTDWQRFTFLYDVPEPNNGNVDYVGVWGDTSGGNGSVLIDSVRADVVADEGDLPAYGAQYTAKVDVNGLVGGFGVYNDGTEVDAGFDVDRFWVGRTNDDKRKPFIVEGGKVYIDTAFIRDASIQEGKIGPITFGKLTATDGTPVTTAAGTLRADMIDVQSLRIGFGQVTGNLMSSAKGTNGRPVWLLDRTGGFELNSSGAGGSMEQRGDRISVYDGNGRLRVRIGRL